MKRSILAAALVALALFAGAAPDAHGGTYKAIQCYERSGAGHHDVSLRLELRALPLERRLRGAGARHHAQPRSHRAREAAATAPGPSPLRTAPRSSAQRRASAPRARTPTCHRSTSAWREAPGSSSTASAATSTRSTGRATGGSYFDEPPRLPEPRRLRRRPRRPHLHAAHRPDPPRPHPAYRPARRHAPRARLAPRRPGARGQRA